MNKFFFLRSWGEMIGWLSLETQFVKATMFHWLQMRQHLKFVFCLPCSITFSWHKINSSLICVDYQTSRNIVCFDKVSNHVCHGCPFLLPCFWWFSYCCSGYFIWLVKVGFHEVYGTRQSHFEPSLCGVFQTFRFSTFKDVSNDWLDNWCIKALANISHAFQHINVFIFQFWFCFQNWKMCKKGSNPSCYNFFQMWFELSSWCEPFIKRSSTQFSIRTTNFSWFFMEGFQVMKSTSEIAMLFQYNKYGRPKVCCKPIGVSTSCFSSLCWLWIFILLVVFLLDFLLCNQSSMKVFSWSSNKSFQGCGGHLLFFLVVRLYLLWK